MAVPRSVFRDEAILLQEYLPHQIPHREAQLKKLELYFQGVAQNASKASQTVMITGPVGAGKTMLAKKLLFESLPRKAALYGNLVKTVHVNCRIDRTLQAIMVKALKSLGQTYPTRGYSFEELLAALVEELRSNRMHLVIAFDEVDSLVLSDPSSLYTITRLREMSPGGQVLSSILISKTTDYLKKVDLSTLSSLQWNEISLDHYPSEQLADIIASRSEAFNDGCLDDDTIQFAADVAGVFGDARYALDLVWRAGKLADDSESTRVLPEHIRSAKASLPPQLRKEELAYLTHASEASAHGHLHAPEEGGLDFGEHRRGGEELLGALREHERDSLPPHPGVERYQRTLQEGHYRDTALREGGTGEDDDDWAVPRLREGTDDRARERDGGRN